MNRMTLMKDTISTAWPAVLESFFISLAGMIDTMMVSSLGTYAVSAVGLTTQPKFISLCFFFAINVAVSALVARRRGQNNRKNANEVLVTAFSVALVLCILLSLCSIIFADPIIQFAGSSADTHTAAVTYFKVIQGGMIFNVISMIINASQRGSGNTKIAMTTNIASSLVNICFNYLLINGNLGFPKWGLFGAAIATVLGTVVASIMSIHSLFKKDSYVSIPYIMKEKIRPVTTTLSSITNLGSNILAENIAMRVGFLVTSLLAARLGTDAFAAHNVGMNFLTLGFSFGDGMQVAAVALIGRSLGEKNPEKARSYGNTCQFVGAMISIVLALILFFFGRDLFGLFFSQKDILDDGTLISRFIMVIVLFQISQIIFGGCLRGAGDVKYTLVASLISVTIIRSLVTYILVVVWPLGLVGIWIGVLSDQLSRFILLGIRFKQGNWVNYQI